MKKIVSHNRSETVAAGKMLASRLSPGDLVAFYGDLGTGKTAFIAGIAEGLGYSGEVTSPTFALVHEYVGGRLPLYHFDLYRINSEDDLYSTGFYEYLDAGGVLAVEWSEKLGSELPKGAIRIRMSYGEKENARTVQIEGITDEDFSH